MDYNKYSEMLKALGHPIRLKIVEGLIDKEECNVTRMVNALNVPQSTVSQHLSILKSRGIITSQKKGVENCYSVNDEKVKTIIKLMK